MPPVTVHPIRTDADHRAALARIEHLMAADTPADDDELTVLAALVEDWEDRHIPMAPPEPLAAIRFRMEQQGLTLDDLAPLLGGQARAEDVLAGRRDLTVPMIRALRDHLGIPADVLIGHGPASAA
ncbi:helix-turn-helix domain-containing protein [Rhodospira trueperi]|uniref:HTH-type transcriptional regulator / antitoxin HigA n=1 Tax=Rhodospira trueperi TaxID=69960 RepID=A0A1G6Z2K7_9PROT|nr:hypothetical protein [Rhodospira trueperi]SDD96889.1 HTH-type transcriptional regulator / antitoxin HigA [Rhodospira trueperi]